MFTSLLDYSASVEPVYDDRAKIMTVMLIVLIFLILIVIFLIGVIIINKKNNRSNLNQTEISQEEQSVINKYRNLKESDKHAINQMLNSLNNSDKE